MTAPCRCTHPRRNHGNDRHGRPTCFGSFACGCDRYRPASLADSMNRHPAGKGLEKK